MRPFIKKIYYLFLDLKLFLRRKFWKLGHKIIKREKSYRFAILCIKKTEYADMSIVNANSMHTLNPNHSFIFYCDDVCANYLEKNKSKFDYPNKISIVNKYGNATKAWQYYKIEVHIDAARNGYIDTDADGIWHNEPQISSDKITMLAHAHNFLDQPNEIATLKNIFPNEESWLSYRHCVAAFVSIPQQYMNDKVADDMRRVNDAIFSNSFDFLATEKERGDARRLSEEFAVNIAIQSNFPQEHLVVLKEKDGWGNKNILQSLYYGCGNQINE